METIDIIRNLCKKKGISLSALEKIMGYGNASLSKATKIPFDRIAEISDYFGVPIDYFRTGEEPSIGEQLAALPYDPQDIKDAMRIYSQYQNASPEIQKAIELLLKSSQSES